MPDEHLAMPLFKKHIRATADLDDPDNAVIGCAVYDANNDYVTTSLPEAVCDELVEIVNTHHYDMKRGYTKQQYAKPIVYLRIGLEPMAKPDDRLITLNQMKNQVIRLPLEYSRYINEFADYYINRHKPVRHRLPIDFKCQITAMFYCSTKANTCIIPYYDALLDCLEHCGIIKNKGHRIVNNMDGSRLYYDSKKPRTEIFIRDWSNTK
jgi:hypothetical protein